MTVAGGYLILKNDPPLKWNFNANRNLNFENRAIKNEIVLVYPVLLMKFQLKLILICMYFDSFKV